MQFDYKEIHKRLTTATAVFSDSSSTIDRARAAVSLLVGISPRTDALCTECLRHLDTIGHIERGELTEIGVHALSEETEDQKRRKKALLLLLKGWKDLQAEVARYSRNFRTKNKAGVIALCGGGYSALQKALWHSSLSLRLVLPR